MEEIRPLATSSTPLQCKQNQQHGQNARRETDEGQRGFIGLVFAILHIVAFRF
ncbi:MAG TPA: hypothetical protein VGB61_05935 [Pyrinomonadaceae bacterium]